jgi:hypothetical protein
VIVLIPSIKYSLPNTHVILLHAHQQVRREMLLSLKDCPSTLGQDISTKQWLGSIGGNIVIVAVTAALASLLHSILVVRWKLGILTVLGGWATGVVLITAMLFVYYVYIVDSGTSGSSSTRSKSSGSTKESEDQTDVSSSAISKRSGIKLNQKIETMFLMLIFFVFFRL